MEKTKDNTIAVIDKLLEWSIYLTLFALPFSKSIVEICVFSGIALLVAKKITTKNFTLPKTPANLPLLCIFLTALASLVNSQYMALSVRALFLKNLKFIMLYFLVIDAIDNGTKMRNLLKMGLLSAVIIFIDTFTQYFITHCDFLHNYPSFKYVLNYCPGGKNAVGSIEYFIGYPTGSFPFPNDLAAWLLIVIPAGAALSLLDLKNMRARLGMFVFSLVGLYIFVLAKARGAWLGLILSLLSLFFLRTKKTVIFLILAAVLALVFACFRNSPQVVFGISSMKDREAMWSTGIKIWKEHPVIGSGINTFFNRFKETREDQFRGRKGSYAHNCYLQMAADTGILGLGAFLWFAASLLQNAFAFLKSCRDKFYYALSLGLVLGIEAFLIHSFFDTNLYSLNLASLFWLAAGVLISTMKISAKQTA